MSVLLVYYFVIRRRFFFFFCSVQTKLSTFDIGSNRITSIENIEHLKELTEFWVSTLNH